LWAAKTFALLFIPPEDKFWDTPEAELPIHKENFSYPIKEPGLVMVGTKSSGHVQIVNQKPYHDKAEYNARYTNFAYSSIFSYEARPVYKHFNCDNSLSFSEDGINFRQRWKTENLCCEENFAAAKYPMFEVDEEGTVYSAILVKDDFMINIHEVNPTKDKLVFKEGGYPLGFDEGSPLITSTKHAEMASINNKTTFIKNLHGYTQQFKAQGFHEMVCGSNSRYHQSVVPSLGTETRQAKTFYLASMVYGKVGDDSIDQLMALVSSFKMVGNKAYITFYDGEEAFVQVGKTEKVNLQLGGEKISGKVVMAKVSSKKEKTVILE
jgi:hypothetical protein